MRSLSVDVAVAGLGAMGSAVAYHLARRGHRVLGLDPYDPPHDLGSSHGESRIIREAYFEHPAYVPLVQRAYGLWRDLEEQTGQALLRTTGALMIGRTDGELVAGAERSAREHGLVYERLSAGEIQRRFPVLNALGLTGIYEPRAGILSPERCIVAHLQAARAAGALLRPDEAIVGWHHFGSGVELVTTRNRYSAGALVIAAGAWMPELLPWLPLRVERQVTCWFRPLSDAPLFGPDRLPVYLWELGPGLIFYGIPDLGSGVKAARHHGGADCSASDADRVVTEPEVNVVRRFLHSCIPRANGPLLRASVCLYTNTPSGHFLIGQQPEEERVWIVSPCSGHGFKFSSAIGESVARAVEQAHLPSELSMFSLAAHGVPPDAGKSLRRGGWGATPHGER